MTVDEIDLGGGFFTPVIEIPNVTITPNENEDLLTAPPFDIIIPELIVAGLTLRDIPAKVTLKNGVLAEQLTLNIEVLVMSLVRIDITYNGSASDDFFEGDGISTDPWRLHKLVDFMKLMFVVNFECPTCPYYKYIQLMKDMNFSYYQGEWEPIGINPNSAFAGVFDGNNKKITGLKIKHQPAGYQEYIGVFGYVGNGTVKNLGVEDIDIDFDFFYQEYGEAYMGGVAACIGNESKILNCYSTADVESSSEIYAVTGGIAGFIYASAVKNCYSTGKVKSNSQSKATTGGVAGEIGESYESAGSNISECAALNPSLVCTGAEIQYGRVVGHLPITPIDTLDKNGSFEGMLKPDGNVNWEEVCPKCPNGINITKEEISAD